MSISATVTLSFNNSITQLAAFVSNAVTTTAAASTFYAVIIQHNPSLNTPISVTDSKGNTYTQVGTTINDTQQRTMWRYICQNGVGGAGHTMTVTNTSNATGTATAGTTTTLTDTTKSWTTNQWAGYNLYDSTQQQQVTIVSNTANTLTYTAPGWTPAVSDAYIINGSIFSVAFYEIKGGVLTGILDQSNTSTGFFAAPYASGNVTISSGNVVNGELIISTCGSNSNTVTWSEANGFTIAANNVGANFPGQNSIACGIKNVATAGTYSASWNDLAGTSYVNIAIDTFIGGTGSNSCSIAWVS